MLYEPMCLLIDRNHLPSLGERLQTFVDSQIILFTACDPS